MKNLFGFPNQKFVYGYPTSEFTEESLDCFKSSIPEANYPTRVLEYALTLEFYNGNEQVAYVFDPCFPSVYGSEKVLELLTLKTSLAVLTVLKAWWQSRQDDVTDSRLERPAVNWLNEALAMIHVDWIYDGLEFEISSYCKGKSFLREIPDCDEADGSKMVDQVGKVSFIDDADVSDCKESGAEE